MVTKRHEHKKRGGARAPSFIDTRTSNRNKYSQPVNRLNGHLLDEKRVQDKFGHHIALTGEHHARWSAALEKVQEVRESGRFDKLPARFVSDVRKKVYNVKITPAEALGMLCTVRSNRVVKEYIVTKYALDMLNGRFLPNGGDAFAVDPDGNLWNGNHRLWACVVSGVPLTVAVEVGFPLAEVPLIDGSTNTRSHKQMLEYVFRGKMVERDVIKAVKIILSAFNVPYANVVDQPDPPVARFMHSYEHVIQKVWDATPGKNAHVVASCRKGELIAAMVVMMVIDEEFYDEFMVGLRDITAIGVKNQRLVQWLLAYMGGRSIRLHKGERPSMDRFKAFLDAFITRTEPHNGANGLAHEAEIKRFQTDVTTKTAMEMFLNPSDREPTRWRANKDWNPLRYK